MLTFTPVEPPASRPPSTSTPTHAKASDIGLAAFYNQVMGRRGFEMAPHHYPMVAALEDKRIQNILFMVPAGGGKSNLLDIVYPTLELGRDPTLTILSVSAGERLPQTFLQAAMSLIKDDPTFAKAFPEVRPDAGTGWSLERGLYVTGHHPSDENPSYFCAGLGSKALTGLHCRVMILDDIHDEENSRTPEGRAEVVNRYYRTLLDRADPRGCRRVAVGRWWAEDDVYQEWMKSGDWVVMQLPATRPGGDRQLWFDVTVPIDPDTGQPIPCIFSEGTGRLPDDEQTIPGVVRYRAYYAAVDPTGMGFYWPQSPTKRKNYLAVRRRQPRIAAVNYDGDMAGGSNPVFNESDFRPYAPPGDLSRGIQDPATRAWVRSLKGEIEEAWDTALGQPQSASLTVALTGLFVPCQSWHCGEDPDLVGPCDFHYDVYLLDLMSSNLDFRQLAMALRTRFGLWHPRRVIVEEKQSGVGLLQTFRGTQIPVVGQKVEQGKLERAINPVFDPSGGLPIPGGAASVQGWARMGRVLIPAGAPWLTQPHEDATVGFLQRVTAFAGGTRAADEFDALVHLVTRAIVLSRRTAYMPGVAQTGERASRSPDSSDPPPFGYEDPRAASLATLQALAALGASHATDSHGNSSGDSGVVNPFEGLCAAPCHHYAVERNQERCRHPSHPRVTRSIEGCTDWARPGSVSRDDDTLPASPFIT